MQVQRPLEQVIVEIQEMPRQRCIAELTHFEGLPLDFDAAFLAGRSDEWLRHTLLAATLTVRANACGSSHAAVLHENASTPPYDLCDRATRCSPVSPRRV